MVTMIERTDVSAHIPEEVEREVVAAIPEGSAVLSLARQLPNMSRNQKRIPVMSQLATAYFVNGDTGLKSTTSLKWKNKYLNAEEVAAIIPIPEAVLNDMDYDIWGQSRPEILRAIGLAVDLAMIYGTNAPSTWPQNLLAGATAASNVVDLSVVVGAGGDLYTATLGEGGVYEKVEVDGFGVSGNVAPLGLKAKLRNLREPSNGKPIFNQSLQEGVQYALDGSPILFPKNGSMDAAQFWLMCGDFDELVYSIRQDVTFKILDQAVIQDSAGTIVYNLAQQDMVALRVVVRLAWELPNPVNAVQPTEANRYPFGFLIP